MAVMLEIYIWLVLITIFVSCVFILCVIAHRIYLHTKEKVIEPKRKLLKDQKMCYPDGKNTLPNSVDRFE